MFFLTILKRLKGGYVWVTVGLPPSHPGVQKIVGK